MWEKGPLDGAKRLTASSSMKMVVLRDQVLVGRFQPGYTESQTGTPRYSTGSWRHSANRRASNAQQGRWGNRPSLTRGLPASKTGGCNQRQPGQSDTGDAGGRRSVSAEANRNGTFPSQSNWPPGKGVDALLIRAWTVLPRRQ